MKHALVAQATHEQIELGLYLNNKQKDLATVPKREASSHLIIAIKNLLENHKLSCSNLLYIGANQGPAPFTTLRILIATLNGIHFASHVPLVGVDGLQTFFKSTQSENYPQTVILLNAYNQEAYFAYKKNKQVITGWNNITVLLKQIADDMPENTIRFLGNGATLFSQEIIDTIGERAFLPHPTPKHPSLESITHAAHSLFEQGDTVKLLKPLYLKKHPAQK